MGNFVVLKRPGQRAVLDTTDDVIDGDTISKAIDDAYFTCTHLRLDDEILDIWCDDEGLLKDLPLNFYNQGSQPIVGPVLVCQANEEGESIPLSKELAEKVASWLDKHGYLEG